VKSAAVALALAACATAPPVSSPPQGYIVAEIEVRDGAAYREYAAAVAPIVAQYGGRYLVRGGTSEAKEGVVPAGRAVIIAFPTLAAARTFYDSPEYAAIAPLRLRSSSSRVFLVEGVPP
jgi:uncharacterized protein (DUF1330 family)